MVFRCFHFNKLIMSVVTIAYVIAALAAVYTMWAYNALIRLRNAKDEALSGIEVQFKKRYDLIPNLVETVKGYATHEKELLTQLTSLRSAQNLPPAGAHLPVGQLQEAEKQFSGVFTRLMAVAENYPQLKADRGFTTLQRQLMQIEQDLEMARRFFNGTVRNLNNKVESFPSNVVASAFGFSKEAFFQTESPAEQNPPKVQF